ncbi:MAG: dephospho-CoA kinase [Acidobacteriota bacterium]
MERFLLGVTGGLASGKSTVVGWLADAGFHVVDADRVVAELYAPGGAGAAALAELLGHDVLDADGAVDKPKVASIIFSDADAKARVERAIHPLVHSHFRAMATRLGGVVVYEATLLVESGHAENFDLVITIEAPDDRRLDWAIARGMTRDEAAARLRAQGDGAARRAGADRILDNTGTLDDLRRAIDALIDELRSKVA